MRGYKASLEFLANPVDQGFIDGLVNGFGYLSQAAAQWLRQLQNGFVRSYALVVLFGVVAILSLPDLLADALIAVCWREDHTPSEGSI